MKIAYDSSLAGGRKSKGYRPQRMNWSFTYGEETRHIPVIYRFSQGIVFDIITILDKNKVQAFYDRYTALEDSLTPSEQRFAEQEHPFQAVEVAELRINGKRAQEYSGSSGVYMPFGQPDKALLRLRRQYAGLLKSCDCFACQRFCVPYPQGAVGKPRLWGLLPDKIRQFALATHAVDRFYPLDIPFHWQEDESSQELSFRHPATGQTHTLYLQDPEPLTLPVGEAGEQTLHILQLQYRVSPALPKGDRLDFSSHMQYTPPREDAFSPVSACSVGIIGCADGPTSILVATKDVAHLDSEGAQGTPLYHCFSIPAFEKQSTYTFVLEGILSSWRPSAAYHFEAKK